jgi:hypothetical protein
MEQFDGQVLEGQEKLVCKLQKSLYGLKQSSRTWYQKLNNFVIENNFCKLQSNNNVYINTHEGVIITM